MNRCISHSVLLNNGAAAAFLGIAATKYDPPSIVNIALFVMSAILAWHAGNAAEADFRRMKQSDAVIKPDESHQIDDTVLTSIKAFKYVIAFGALLAIGHQLYELGKL